MLTIICQNEAAHPYTHQKRYRRLIALLTSPYLTFASFALPLDRYNQNTYVPLLFLDSYLFVSLSFLAFLISPVTRQTLMQWPQQHSSQAWGLSPTAKNTSLVNQPLPTLSMSTWAT